MLDQNPFGASYESRLIAALLRDRLFLHSFLPLFAPDYFVLEVNKAVYVVTKDFADRYKRAPDKTELEVRLNETVSEQYPADKAVQELALFQIELESYWRYTASELEFVTDNARKYAQQRACELAVRECAQIIGTPKEHMMPEIMQRALLVGTKLTDYGTDYFGDRRIRALKRYSRPREMNRIPFFIPKFDETIGGVGFRRDGSGVPELLMFGGGANKGKSRCIAHMAKVGVSLGLNGVIFSSEMAEDLYSERLDMSMARLDTKELYDPNNFDRLQRRIDLFANQGARLWIKKFPSQTTTIRETLAIARLIESTAGLDLHFIGWDYTSEFRAENQKAERRDQVAEMIRSQHMVVDEMECAGIGAFQLNREGSRAEMAQLEHAAEDITVARVADTVVVIAQTEEEEQKDPPEMRWCARKVRSEERNQTALLIDERKRMCFTAHPNEVSANLAM